MFVDVNCVQLAAFCADVLITLERSIILLRETLPELVPEDADVTAVSYTHLTLPTIYSV